MSDGQFTQDFRVAKLATPLGKDKLLLSRFDVTEGMGEMFEIRVEAVSLDPNINFDDALGRNCSIHLDTVDGTGRDFSGVLTEARALGRRGDVAVYSLVLRPWLWLMSYMSDCRIFPHATARDIIKQVFSDRGFTDVLDLATHDYPELEYTVQYRETDLNFVLRLMEEYGIYYYFQFEPGDGVAPSTHFLVIADSETHLPLPAPTTVKLNFSTDQARRDAQEFDAWSRSQSIVTSTFALTDYNYEKPNSSMLVKAQMVYNFQHGDMELFNYPGGYMVQDNGLTLAEVSRDVERTRNARASAFGYVPSLTPGFTIQRGSMAGGDPEDGEYLCLRCTHSFGNQDYSSTSGTGAGEASYTGSYELSRSSIPYKMPQRTRKPVVVGAHSALVVGKKDEEIDIDEDARVLVQFYWDRKKMQSRRVRVATPWAGDTRGFIFPPRIGDEVMISYEDGDPDRPYVSGSMFNGINKLKYDDTNKEISEIRSRSTKKSNGYNLLRFYDKTGAEEIRIRAQRDLMIKALRNEVRVINGSQSESVGGDKSQTVGGNVTITVGGPKGGGDYSLSTEKTISLTAKTKLTLTVGASSITMTPSDITIKAPMVYINP